MSKGLSRRQVLKWIGAGAVTGVSASAYSGICTDDLRVEASTLRIPNWTAEGVRIAFLADLHFTSEHALHRSFRVVDRVRELKPDFIFLGGDYINHPEPLEGKRLGAFLGELVALGVPTYGIIGNHDYLGGTGVVEDAFKHSNLTLLRNGVADLNDFMLVGYDDALWDKADRAMMPNHASAPALALLHEPDYVDGIAARYSLVLSGHSHGGQVCLPNGQWVHTPIGARKYVSGFYNESASPLYVTRGIGTSGWNVRAFCPPEISLLTLRSQA